MYARAPLSIYLINNKITVFLFIFCSPRTNLKVAIILFYFKNDACQCPSSFFFLLLLVQLPSRHMPALIQPC